jgi:hypothetical protein
MRDDIEWLKANSEGRVLRARLDGLEQFVRKGENCRAAVWGTYGKPGVLLVTTQRVLFHVLRAPEASGVEYDAVETVEVHQPSAQSLTLHVFATTFDLAVQGITDTIDLRRVVGAIQEAIDQTNAAAGRLARFAGITVTPSEVRSDFGSGPLIGARAEVDTGGNLTRRPRVGYVLAFGVLGLAASKTVDERELYLSVEGQGFGFAIQLPPWRATEARSFASQLNGAQVGAAAQAPAAVPSGAEDPFEQVRKLGELRDAKLISDDEFEAKKTEILSRI